MISCCLSAPRSLGCIVEDEHRRERLAARTCAAVSGSFDSGHRPVVGGVLEPGLELRGGTV